MFSAPKLKTKPAKAAENEISEEKKQAAADVEMNEAKQHQEGGQEQVIEQTAQQKVVAEAHSAQPKVQAEAEAQVPQEKAPQAVVVSEAPQAQPVIPPVIVDPLEENKEADKPDDSEAAHSMQQQQVPQAQEEGLVKEVEMLQQEQDDDYLP